MKFFTTKSCRLSGNTRSTFSSRGRRVLSSLFPEMSTKILLKATPKDSKPCISKPSITCELILRRQKQTNKQTNKQQSIKVSVYKDSMLSKREGGGRSNEMLE